MPSEALLAESHRIAHGLEWSDIPPRHENGALRALQARFDFIRATTTAQGRKSWPSSSGFGFAHSYARVDGNRKLSDEIQLYMQPPRF